MPNSSNLLKHQLRRLQAGHSVQRRHLVEAPLHRSLGRRAVVADDVVDERVVEDVEIAEGVEDAADVVVGLLEEAGVDLHLARQDRLELGRHVVPGGDLLRPRGQLRVLGDHAQLLLPREGLLAQLVPALIELALVLGRPGRRDVVGRVRRAGRVVHEEGLVGDQRLLLPDPVDRAVGQILVQRVALLGRAGRLDGGRPFEEPRVVLVRLAADEAVEVLEARAGRPVVERAHRARLPHRDLVALAELRGRVAVQLQDLGQRRLVQRADAVVAGRGGRRSR